MKPGAIAGSPNGFLAQMKVLGFVFLLFILFKVFPLDCVCERVLDTV